MKTIKIKALTIAKKRYKFINQINLRLNYQKWIDYIDNHQNYYTWLENTEQGKERIANIDQIPESFRSGIIEQLNKTQALAEFNTKKGFYEIVVDFNKGGFISTTFMKPIKKVHLIRLLDLANHMEAFLINNGTQIIDQELIESLA